MASIEGCLGVSNPHIKKGILLPRPEPPSPNVHAGFSTAVTGAADL